MSTDILEVRRVAPARVLLADRYFYLFMAILVAVVVASGFSQTIDANLIHPKIPRPHILYLHAALFVGWVVFFISQTALIRTRNLRWHRRLGAAGAILGVLMVVVGIATAIAMRRFRVAHDASESPAFLSVTFNDLVAFSVALGLAVWWRRWPEYHRRLMLLATLALTGAGFARFPLSIMDNPWWWYPGVDLLILLAVARDLVVIRKVHPVYLYGLPLLMLGEYGAVYLFLHPPGPWLAICRALIA